jgi:hypothetical protein
MNKKITSFLLCALLVGSLPLFSMDVELAVSNQSPYSRREWFGKNVTRDMQATICLNLYETKKANAPFFNGAIARLSQQQGDGDALSFDVINGDKKYTMLHAMIVEDTGLQKYFNNIHLFLCASWIDGNIQEPAEGQTPLHLLMLNLHNFKNFEQFATIATSNKFNPSIQNDDDKTPLALLLRASFLGNEGKPKEEYVKAFLGRGDINFSDVWSVHWNGWGANHDDLERHKIYNVLRNYIVCFIAKRAALIAGLCVVFGGLVKVIKS